MAFTKEQQEEMVKLYTVEELSLRKIAEKFSCTPPTVSNNLRKNGVTLRGKGRKRGTKIPKKTTAPKVTPALDKTFDEVPNSDKLQEFQRKVFKTIQPQQ